LKIKYQEDATPAFVASVLLFILERREHIIDTYVQFTFFGGYIIDSGIFKSDLFSTHSRLSLKINKYKILFNVFNIIRYIFFFVSISLQTYKNNYNN